ncbi:MAG: ABC transporter permease subunit [Clostridiales bacterium]|jgi:putative aldouronate transport system permease protein|nr:ABC transporter permease subunit [Clostridiales bacterium]
MTNTVNIGKGRRAANYLQRYWGLYAMLLLPLAFFFLFRYFPMVNLVLAFKQNTIFSPWDVPWAQNWGILPAMDNFRLAIEQPQFRLAFRNTIVFSLLDLVAGFPAPIILALLLNELKFPKFKRVTQTISYMPHFLSWIIISGMAVRLFSTNVGTINGILSNFGISAIPFLDSERHWVGSIVFLGVWKSIGWNTIIYLAAITNVNPELYESAEMDGASRLRKIWHVTLPGIQPVIVILLILAIGGIMGADFDRFLAMGNPLVERVSNVLPLYIWNWGLRTLQYAQATAVGLMQNTINFALLLSANFIVRRLGDEGLW